MRVSVLALTAVLSAGAAGADVPRVAVDIAPVHSIVAAVMGDLGQPDLIVPIGASPHGHSMRPSEARALDRADLVVWVGPGLAPWMVDPMEGLASGAEVMTLLDLPQTKLLDVRTGATFAPHDHGDHGDHDEHGHDDHADDAAGHDDHDHDDHAAKDADHDDHDDHGHDDHDHAAKDDHDHGHDDHAEDAAAHDDHGHDDHGHEDHAEDAAVKDDHDDHAGHDHADHASNGHDPHAWLDPDNAATWARAVAQSLGTLDPENADTYTANAASFSSEINTLKDDINAQLEGVRGKPFVVFHDAYAYFEGQFGLSAVGAISEGDASSPSPARVAELRDEVAELGAICALSEPQFNPGIIDALGTTRLGVIDPLGFDQTPGPDLYPAVLRSMAASLRDCLE